MKIVNALLSIVLMFFISIDIQAQNFNRAVKVKENFEAAIPHPEQDKEVTNKLAALEKKTGKKPNIVWIVIDDMGYGDPGAYWHPYTLPSRSCQPHQPKLAKEYGCPTARTKRKHGHTTLYKSNSG